MKKKRIDLLLVDRGLAESRNQAQRLIMAGEVRVEGEMVHKSSTTVLENANIEIKQHPKYVSRGGKKLEAAIEAFDVDVSEKVCADVGASTGGFTDCLLQNNAKRVYAVDVGYGILHWKLRNHPKVVVMERTNARYLEHLPEPVDLVTIDASFISLGLILPAVKGWFESDRGQTIALIKPQFEAGREAAAKHAGVIKDEEVHERVLQVILNKAIELGFSPVGLIPSPIIGPKGNLEFLVELKILHANKHFDLDCMINKALGAISF